MFSQFQETLTFDDVLLVPQASSILPAETILKTKFTRDIELNLPFVSAPMDTVTEHKMAIAMALAGGIGIIHKNLSIDKQAREIRKVKRFENGFVENPIAVGPNDKISKVIEIRKNFGYKKTPVVDEAGKLLGIISDADYFVLEDQEKLVSERMNSVENMMLGNIGMSLEEANKMVREYKLRTLCLVDETGKLTSIVTRRDIEKNHQFPNACKNGSKQLRVGGSVGVGIKGIERAEALVNAGADVLVVDTAHGHSKGVINTVKELKSKFGNIQIVAGNIATGEAARELIEAGADAVKVGIGPGSICTTRVVAGVGVPQLSAIIEVVQAVNKYDKTVPVIADGGIKTSGDVVKALAAGASSVMMGNVFSGTDESPGKIQFKHGRMYKVYRGMGSTEAMERGSKDRYGQADVKEKNKFVPEGVSGRVPYKGAVDNIIYQMAGGLRSGMGYCGAEDVTKLSERAVFVKISNASLKENHPHDLGGIESAPNYRVEE